VYYENEILYGTHINTRIYNMVRYFSYVRIYVMI
jgi:hypothetical protein